MDIQSVKIKCKKQVKNMSVFPAELLSIVAEHLDLSTCRTFSKVFSIAHGVFRRRFSVELGRVFARFTYDDSVGMMTIVKRGYKFQIFRLFDDFDKTYHIYSNKLYNPRWWTGVHEWVCKENAKFKVYSTFSCPLECNICRDAKKRSKWIQLV